MADIKDVRQFINGLNRPLSLSTNTVVVDNLKIKMGSGDDNVHATFSGSLTAARTISVPDANVDLGKIATNESAISTANTKIGNLESLSGMASGSTTLGTFTGSTIADNSTVKSALQALETAGETTASGLSSHVSNTSNPHSVTASQVGLGNVTNNAQVKKIASSVDGNFIAWDGTTGDLPKDSGFNSSSFATASHNHTGVYEPANANIQSHISSTSNPHSVTASQVGLGNVTNDAQIKKISSAVNENIVIFDGTTGDAVKDSGKKLSDYILASEKGANSGVATLDAGGKVPVSQLPNSVMELQGFFDPSSTSLADGSGNPGDVWEASVAGSHDFGSGAISFKIGDWAVYAADGKYHKSINSNEVTSVNGQTGTVSLSTDNVSEGSTNKYFTDSRAKTAAVSDSITDGITDVAPSQNAVYDALALKANDSIVVKTVNGQSPTAGAVTISTDNVSEGSTNKYFTESRSINSILSGYTSGAGTVASTDSVIQAIQKLDGNIQSVGGVNPFIRSEVAGESFAANKSFVVRFGLSSETAGRVYKADKSAGSVGSETNTYYGYGIAVNSTASAINAAANINVYLPNAIVTLQSSDTAFAAGDVGKPVYMSAAGAFSTTIPSSSNDAVVVVGVVKTTSSFVVGHMQILGVI
jgi:hypothetical protein